MAELRVISAGAGTGKTWRLAKELLDALTDPTAPVAPEGVVAVTFTRTAAAELEQRVRTALIDAGQLELARRLAAARIGTVHAVCARLIEEHAFQLGLSPEIETIDDVVAGGLFEEALAAAVTDAQRSELDDLEQRFTLGDQGAVFFRQVRILVNRARSNELDDDDLARSCAMSIGSLRAALPTPATAAEVERQLAEACQQVLDRTSDRGAEAFRKDLDAVRRARSALRLGETLPWSTWSSLEESRFRPVGIAAARHLEHPAFGEDLERMCRLVFDVARQTMRRYADDKRAAGVVDFTDQERLAVSALEQPEVAASLAADVQLLLVDEFQDTSPLQLRLFNALRQVTRRTVIVGDEKQSIFGFRDARPEFFALLASEAGSTDRLGTSYRSRPGLVRAVSAVFAEAFAATHRREEIVLDAALQQEPPGLGPIAERWTAEQGGDGGSSERVGDEVIIAAGIAEILGTRDVPVRPRASGEGMVRPAQARDIAVLCRTNSECRAVARALHRRGVPVVHARRGLSKTFEARLIGAALGLWLDDRDVLSRIALVQLLEAERDDVAAVVARSDRGEAFIDHPAVVAVVEGSRALPWAGLVQAFDRVVDVLRIPEHLATLPSPHQRLADLAALRALAVRFVEECVARGRGPTIAGYLDRLETLRTATRDDDDSDDDNRGVVAGEDAVTILTWHRAKGKEWPLVVLASLWKDPLPRPFEPVVETTVSLPDLQRPGFGQWLRYWPSPYAENRKSTLQRTLLQSPVLQKAEAHERDGDRRLLYVAFTRARDRLILVGDQTLWGKGMLRTLQRDGRPLCGDPPGDHGIARWAGVDVDAIVHKPSLKAKVPARGAPLVLPERPTGPRPVHPPMFLQPSAQEGSGVAGDAIALGAPVLIKATTRDELNPVGVCVHAFLAWDAFVDGADPSRHARAAAMVERFAVKEWITPSQLLTIADQLWRALDARFPGHRRRTEVPMLHRLPSGTLMRGQLDLLLDLPDGGAVVVDHKTTWDEDVVGYAGQLAAYRAAVVAAGQAGAVQTWIHLPLHARLVEVTTTTSITTTT